MALQWLGWAPQQQQGDSGQSFMRSLGSAAQMIQGQKRLDLDAELQGEQVKGLQQAREFDLSTQDLRKQGLEAGLEQKQAATGASNAQTEFNTAQTEILKYNKTQKMRDDKRNGIMRLAGSVMESMKDPNKDSSAARASWYYAKTYYNLEEGLGTLALDDIKFVVQLETELGDIVSPKQKKTREEQLYAMAEKGQAEAHEAYRESLESKKRKDSAQRSMEMSQETLWGEYNYAAQTGDVEKMNKLAPHLGGGAGGGARGGGGAQQPEMSAKNVFMMPFLGVGPDGRTPLPDNIKGAVQNLQALGPNPKKQKQALEAATTIARYMLPFQTMLPGGENVTVGQLAQAYLQVGAEAKFAAGKQLGPIRRGEGVAGALAGPPAAAQAVAPAPRRTPVETRKATEQSIVSALRKVPSAVSKAAETAYSGLEMIPWLGAGATAFKEGPGVITQALMEDPQVNQATQQAIALYRAGKRKQAIDLLAGQGLGMNRDIVARYLKELAAGGSGGAH